MKNIIIGTFVVGTLVGLGVASVIRGSKKMLEDLDKISFTL